VNAESRVSSRRWSEGTRSHRNQQKKQSGISTWNGPHTKLFGGVKNLLVAPLELPAAMSRSYHADGASAALFSGTVQGLSNVVKRAGSGVADVATFPVKYPNESYANSMATTGPIQLFRGSRKRVSSRGQ
jgi:putative exosortase-associated protein (TIGR04073 family)